MKKLLLALSLLAGGAAHAQITPERTYPTIVAAGKLSTGDVKFAGYFSTTSTTGQVRVYNNNHSVFKQVNVTLPAGATVEDITYLSDKLFNTNSGLEFVLNIRTSIAAGSNYGTRIVDENGTVLLARDTTAYPQIYGTPLGTKMQLNFYASGVTKVYALGGTLTSLRVAPGATADGLLPYPNPTSADVRLPYEVPAGKVAQLVVRDATGRQVASYQVDSTFDHLLFSTRGLAPGVYLYTVGDGPARRFAVQ